MTYKSVLRWPVFTPSQADGWRSFGANLFSVYLATGSCMVAIPSPPKKKKKKKRIIFNENVSHRWEHAPTVFPCWRRLDLRNYHVSNHQPPVLGRGRKKQRLSGVMCLFYSMLQLPIILNCKLRAWISIWSMKSTSAICWLLGDMHT
jgi:hypothetical protein